MKVCNTAVADTCPANPPPPHDKVLSPADHKDDACDDESDSLDDDGDEIDDDVDQQDDSPPVCKDGSLHHPLLQSRSHGNHIIKGAHN